MSKQQAIVWRDLFDPGWREREAERLKPFLDAIPVMEKLTTIGQRKEPCGECHLQPGERCDVCGARAASPQVWWRNEENYASDREASEDGR